MASHNYDRIRFYDDKTKEVGVFAGSDDRSYGLGDGLPATKASLSQPTDVWGDTNGNVFIADTNNYRVRKVDASGIIQTLVDFQSGDGGPATSAYIGNLRGLTGDSNGNVYYFDQSYCVARKINTAGIISTVGGSWSCNWVNSNGRKFQGSAFTPYATGFTVDEEGNYYIIDNDQIKVARRSTKYNMTALCNGIMNDGIADDTPGGGANPSVISLTVDSKNGNYYVLIPDQHVIKVYRHDCQMKIFAGKIYLSGYNGDEQDAVSATLSYPSGMWMDSNGRMFIADVQNNRIRSITRDGVIHTVAGNGNYGYNGDERDALTAQLANPYAVVGDKYGNLFVADRDNRRIRLLRPSFDGQGYIISTIIGNPGNSQYGNYSEGDRSHLGLPNDLWLNSLGDLYVAQNVWGYNVIIVAPNITATSSPTLNPSSHPTEAPSLYPTFAPTREPTAKRTVVPTETPTAIPTKIPTATPTTAPTATPTAIPTAAPTVTPTVNPTVVPTTTPTTTPTAVPTTAPTTLPTVSPSTVPSATPSAIPTTTPTVTPTTVPTATPTVTPSAVPTTTPTAIPTAAPIVVSTVVPTETPTATPTATPTVIPTSNPTTSPTATPTAGPTQTPSATPSTVPTATPTANTSAVPTATPTVVPSAVPSAEPSATPTANPSAVPTATPTTVPSADPTFAATAEPSAIPTANPTVVPSPDPTFAPTAEPSATPTANPSVVPSADPTFAPTMVPVASPIPSQGFSPTTLPTIALTKTPTFIPTSRLTSSPTLSPTAIRTMVPTLRPTYCPSKSALFLSSKSPYISPIEAPATLMPSFFPTFSSTDCGSICLLFYFLH